jgi:hypothetical protein
MKKSRVEFIQRVNLYGAKELGSDFIDKLTKTIDNYDTFEEIHGCEFAHGQYNGKTRGDCLKMYLEDHYPKCKYFYEWANSSIVFACIKT